MRRLWILPLIALLAGMPVLGADGVPQKPLQLKVTTEFEGATGFAVLAWRDMSSNELGFEILRSDNNGDFRVVGSVGANTTSYRDEVGKYLTGVFSYKVRAFNDAGKSDFSNTVTVWF